MSWMTVQCPTCWEEIEVPVDVEIEGQVTLVEDCHVCCRPMVLTVTVDEEQCPMILEVSPEAD
ncbi:CPXCG motif-containing cysteine-rich protein [Magnetococcus sp. PR-3]|uniref:CPXCG motif-containing cysteine-rich protein n=1 Tax=Magnetococcus sp. PR-3 TaxID=3120355 RepID=UPI002FCE33F5